MSDRRDPEAETHFSQPVRQISSMLLVLALTVGTVAAGLILPMTQMGNMMGK